MNKFTFAVIIICCSNFKPRYWPRIGSSVTPTQIQNVDMWDVHIRIGINCQWYNGIEYLYVLKHFKLYTNHEPVLFYIIYGCNKIYLVKSTSR